MKITKIHVYAVKLPFRTPFVLAYETYKDMPSIIVKIETDNGLVGFGEGVADQHVTGETWESTFTTISEYLAPALIDENPFHLEKIHDIMEQIVHGMPTAKAAIDIACYDLIGKATNQPLYQLLGGPYYPYIIIPHVLSIDNPSKMAQEAKEAVQAGYTNIKMKVGTDVQLDIERIRAVRHAIGPDVQLRVDANQGWQYEADALYVLKAIEDCHVGWIEQPIKATNIKGLAHIRQRTTIPIMIDEGLHNPQHMLQILELAAVDYVNIKLMKCGGIYPALKLLAQAEAAGLRCIIGSMIESSIATAAGTHLAMAKKNIIGNEMSGPLFFSKDIASLRYEGNQLYVSDLPGLGLTIDEQQLKEICFHSKTIQSYSKVF